MLEKALAQDLREYPLEGTVTSVENEDVYPLVRQGG
jgi:hypothetical protein